MNRMITSIGIYALLCWGSYQVSLFMFGVGSADQIPVENGARFLFAVIILIMVGIGMMILEFHDRLQGLRDDFLDALFGKK